MDTYSGAGFACCAVFVTMKNALCMSIVDSPVLDLFSFLYVEHFKHVLLSLSRSFMN